VQAGQIAAFLGQSTLTVAMPILRITATAKFNDLTQSSLGIGAMRANGALAA
jgi:hypothetical protein